MSKITDIFKHKHRISICCPFHFEETPSCLIDLKKEEISCVGCGKHSKFSDLTDVELAVVIMLSRPPDEVEQLYKY